MRQGEQHQVTRVTPDASCGSPGRTATSSLFLVTSWPRPVIGVATPVLAGDVINAITPAAPTPARRHPLALSSPPRGRRRRAVAGAAVATPSRIGEGIIFDLRTQVFDHVQRMPLQFFTRTQTGALVSRLNNDVIGAQQAFTSTLSGVVGNVIQLVLTAGVMFTLSWQVTAALAGAAAGLPAAGPAGRPAAGRDHPRVLPARRHDERHHDRALRRRRRAAGQAVRPARGSRRDRFAGRAARVRDIGVQQAMYGRTFFVAMMLVASLAQALVYGLGGWLAREGHHQRRHGGPLALLLTRLYGPLTALSNVRVDVMSALVSFERVFEVLDLPPAIAERPGAVALPSGAGPGGVPRRALPLPDRGRGLARLAGGRGRARPHGHRAGAARRVASPSSRASWSRSSARPAPASRRSRCWCPGSTT